MTVLDLLKPELVLIKADCSSKDELINKLVEKICETVDGFPIAKEELLQSVYKRELIGGTLLPSGLAVPHTRLAIYEDFVFTIGTAKEPIFHDDIQVSLMALMVSSQSGGPYYLPTVAALTKISMDKDYFTRLAEADNKEDFLKILKERNPELG